MNFFKKLKINLFLFLTVTSSYNQIFSIPFTNLFNPYDILLFKPIPCNKCFQFNVASESSFNTKAFQSSPEDRIDSVINESTKFSDEFRRRSDTLKLWQDFQNYSAAFQNYLGNEPLPNPLPPINPPELLEVNADFSVPVNLMFSAQFALPRNFSFAIYLPFYVVKLNNIKWSPNDPTKLAVLEKIGKFDLHNSWTRTGIGDLTALLWWVQDFPQMKKWLRNVHINIRGGATFPTGKKADLGKLFALPFGFDAGPGVLLGATLELGFIHCVRLGIDAEVFNLFGSKKERRVKTFIDQTDLIFPNIDLVHLFPGFMQHYTLYLKFENFWRSLSATFAYQHTRQHESTISPNSALVINHIANSAESLQEWTYHNLVFLLNYDFYPENSRFAPSVSLFVKYGFNGKRVVSADTVGLRFSLDF